MIETVDLNLHDRLPGPEDVNRILPIEVLPTITFDTECTSRPTTGSSTNQPSSPPRPPPPPPTPLRHGTRRYAGVLSIHGDGHRQSGERYGLSGLHGGLDRLADLGAQRDRVLVAAERPPAAAN